MKQELKTISQQEFTAFFAEADFANYLQSLEMAELRQARGYQTELLGFFADGNLVMVALLSSKKARLGQIFNVDGGPIGDFKYLEAFLSTLKSYLADQKALFCQITPHLVIEKLSSTGDPEGNNHKDYQTILQRHCHIAKHSFSAQLPWQYVKNLADLNADSLLMSFNQTSRQMYKKGLKAELEIKEETDFADLTKLFRQTAERQHFIGKGDSYYKELKQAFSDKAEFIGVHYNNQIIAGGVFIFDRDEVIHLFGGSQKELSNLTGAPTFLQVHAMRLAIKRGYKRYNFYGIKGVFDGSDRILHFKQAFRGQVEHYAPSYDLVINKAKYLAHNLLKKS